MSVGIKYLGHSTFLITTPGGKKLLIDPWVKGNPACPEADKKLDQVDTLLITHSHMDHFADAVEIGKQHQPQVACIYEIATYLGGKGVTNLHPMNKGGGQTVNDVRVTMTDARHSSSIIEDDGAIYDGGEPAGFVVEFEGGLRLYHAGDTCVFPGMSIIAELYKPDICILPIGDLFTMGPLEAAYACKLLGAKKVIPMHYATFPLLTGTPEEFSKLAAPHGTEVIVLKPGQQHTA